MKVVHKVQLGSADIQTVVFRGLWTPLSAQFQNGVLCLWAIVDIRADTRIMRDVIIRGTGHPLDFDLDLHDFVGTVQFAELVFHVWVSSILKEIKE